MIYDQRRNNNDFDNVGGGTTMMATVGNSSSSSGNSSSTSAFSTTNYPHSMREQFKQVLGLELSNDWYQDCLTALQQQQPPVAAHNSRSSSYSSNNMGITVDMILEQMLYHDLRDVVVREYVDGMNNQPQQQSVSTNARLLRNAMTESVASSQQQSGSVVTLPSSFRCCLQVEEICDVAKNSESRMTYMTTTNMEGQQQPPFGFTDASCCHKIFLIDGYHPPEHPLLAMETSSIRTAPGTRLLPGTKVLLFGGIVVRNGMMGIHSGNCLVLGGHVERLIQIQNQAIQTAKQLSGHGIDPTIRALIWNNKHNDDMIDNDNDEDEHESRDVAIVTPTVTMPSQSQQIQPIVSSQRLVQIPTPQSQPPPLLSSIQRISYQRPVAATHQQLYQDDDSRVRQVQSTAAVATASSQSSIQPQNRYLTASSRSQPISTTTGSATSAVEVPFIRPTPYGTTSTVIGGSTPNARNGNTTIMTCAQFYIELNRIVANDHLYKQSLNKVFTVGPMQQIGPKLYFNIEKTSKRHKPHNSTPLLSPPLSGGTSSENKQLQYVMTAKFGLEQHDSLGLVTCRISNEILEQHFPIPATELRKLSKSDKPKSDAIVRDCGKAAQQGLFQLETYEITLEQTSEELFCLGASKPLLDGDVPLLCLKSLKLGTLC